MITMATWWETAADFLNDTVAENPYIPWDMTANPRQMYFLSLPTQEALYGGAAGGGKSVALLAAALQYVQIPGYNALLLRKTFADLVKPDALIPLSFLWLNDTDAVWDGQKKRWLFPSGATLSFGYCDAENDKYIYQGAQYQMIGFDELTQFSETQYQYLLSRLRRRVDLDVLLRARAASNPGGIGHDWVKQRFIVEENPDRPFVPAKLEDNKQLDRESYERSLMLLDPVTRAQLMHGNWDIRPEGNMFKREWIREILDREPNDVIRWHRHWDLAATEPEPGKDPDWVSGTKIGLRRNGLYVISDVQHFRGSPKTVSERVRAQAEIDGKQVTISIEEEGGASGKMLVDNFARVILLGWPVKGIKPSGDKVTRAQPLSAAVEQGRVSLVRGRWINEWLDELCAFPLVQHDDQVDATSGAFNEVGAVVIGDGQVMRTPEGMKRAF